MARAGLRLVVATHNLMNGMGLRELLGTYRRLRLTSGLHLLCLQEGIGGAAGKVARCLGRRYAAVCHKGAPRLPIVYDRGLMRPVKLTCVKLPRLDYVPLWQRLYTGAELKYGVIARFLTARGWLTVVNFHLDAAGENVHRSSQLSCLSRAISSQCGPLRKPPLIACGDTNAFTWQRCHAEPDLRRMLEPLRKDHGAYDAHRHVPQDNHFFSRANEPKIGHRIAVQAGKFGIDFPRRYNIVCSSLPIETRGQITTPASDHDLVWASLRYGNSRFINYEL